MSAPLEGAAASSSVGPSLLQFPGLTMSVVARDQRRLGGTFHDVLGRFAAPAGTTDVTLAVQADGYIATDPAGSAFPAEALGIAEAGISPEEAALRTYISRCADRLLLHAAAVVRNGRVLILGAPSTYGKTTLTLALLARGWRFMSDEIVPVSPDIWHAAPFPRALHIRRPALAVLEQQGLRPALEQSVRLLWAGETILGIPANPEPLGSRLAIAAVVFPRYTRDAQAAPDPLSPALAASRLMQQTLNGGTLGSRAFAWATGLARHVPCYRLPVDALGPAVAALETLVP